MNPKAIKARIRYRLKNGMDPDAPVGEYGRHKRTKEWDRLMPKVKMLLETHTAKEAAAILGVDYHSLLQAMRRRGLYAMRLRNGC